LESVANAPNFTSQDTNISALVEMAIREWMHSWITSIEINAKFQHSLEKSHEKFIVKEKLGGHYQRKL
jgi:hypothetical protein